MHLLTLTVLVINILGTAGPSHKNHNNDLYGYATKLEWAYATYTFKITYILLFTINVTPLTLGLKYILYVLIPWNTLQTWSLEHDALLFLSNEMIKQFWRKWLFFVLFFTLKCFCLQSSLKITPIPLFTILYISPLIQFTWRSECKRVSEFGHWVHRK